MTGEYLHTVSRPDSVFIGLADKNKSDHQVYIKWSLENETLFVEGESIDVALILQDKDKMLLSSDDAVVKVMFIDPKNENITVDTAF